MAQKECAIFVSHSFDYTIELPQASSRPGTSTGPLGQSPCGRILPARHCSSTTLPPPPGFRSLSPPSSAHSLRKRSPWGTALVPSPRYMSQGLVHRAGRSGTKTSVPATCLRSGPQIPPLRDWTSPTFKVPRGIPPIMDDCYPGERAVP